MDLTGNPFVDTGLMTLTALAGRKSVDDLSLADIQTVFGTGDQLARQNQSLKCFTMVFGTNGPLTQPAYKKSGKNKEIYLSILRQLLDFARAEGQAGPRCDLTGVPTNLDFHAVCAKALSEAGVPVPDKKWLGRDWVPLGGSLGNDAQALPAASRPLHVSALALFAFQYLPLGVSLLKGKLTCYQSTEKKLAQAWVTDIVKQNENRLSLGETEILGKGGGTGVIIDRLMRCLEDLSYSHIPGTQALLWLFSNSGTGADCAIEEIPDSTLAFVSNAVASFGSEIRRMIAADPKDSRQQLFECIRGGRDYPGLYPYKKQTGASPEFYDFYQREVRNATPAGLSVARKLARHILSGEEPKRLKEIQKPEFLRSPGGKNLVRKYIVNYLSPAEYDALFPSEHHPIKANPAGWDQLRYYLTTQQIDNRQIEAVGGIMKTTHPKIVQIAETYRGVEPRKIKNILDRMAQRKLGVRWLQDKFCDLAKTRPEWKFGEWDEFVCDEDGKVVAFELLFQLRLYLSNLYREVTTDNKGEAA
jgi:CRISPR-associated protein Cst1